LKSFSTKKEKKIMEYYKSFIKGHGLDKIKESIMSKPITKKRRLRIATVNQTHKRQIKSASLQDAKIDADKKELTKPTQPSTNELDPADLIKGNENPNNSTDNKASK
jgi:hypothetical protein